MTLQEFANTYNGTTVGNGQCPALVNLYMDEVLGITPEYFGDAHNYYDDYDNIPFLKENFYRIPVSQELPKEGDIVVWNTNVAPPYGHVDICYSNISSNGFTSFSQNWGIPLECSFVNHNFTNVSGYLRFKGNEPIIFKKSKFKWVLYANKLRNKRRMI